ncbi:ABC transporter permease [Bifidobacterium crudilactis]|jgi:putative ABC transport system permease protein|uniref:ABC transporter permease n=1 Tax=Bifidobacterium crudilactis TaxID=327277 RepID=UPI00054D8561|nr:ABC transporter permease [Bifidobacterium crudilactis]MCI2148779.1 ABC transporter permease [Bifidobacterium crudilactis]MCI2158075.1 ABC transporter permease [Bifidobacterium crudilactis]
MQLAWKEIRHSKGRYALILAVIVLVGYLSFFLTALSYGLAQANRTSVDAWNASSILLSDDANGNLVSSSVTRAEESKVLGTDANTGTDNTGKSGTKDIEPVSVLQAVTKIKESGSTSGEGFNTVLLGVREDSTLIPQLVSGRNAADEKEAVASESLSTKDGVQLGDSVSVGRAGYTYKIVGFTKTAEYNTEPVIYVRNGTFTLPSAYASMSSDASVTGATADSSSTATATSANTQQQSTRNAASASSDDAVVASGLVIRDASAKVSVPDGMVSLDMQSFINNIPGYQAQVLTFALMIGFLVGVSALVVGIFIYILTMHKRHLFGVLKAQGYSNSFISRSILAQTLILSVIGTLVGLLLSLLTIAFMPVTVPITVSTYWFAIISGVLVLFSLIGAAFSARAVSSIDAIEALS